MSDGDYRVLMGGHWYSAATAQEMKSKQQRSRYLQWKMKLEDSAEKQVGSSSARDLVVAFRLREVIQESLRDAGYSAFWETYIQEFRQSHGP